MKFVDLWWLNVGGMEYPIFSFSYFFRGGHFENAPGEGAHRKIFLLTLQILLL